MNLHLVTTSIDAKKNNCKNIYLGKWGLKNYKNIHINYHWDDRTKLYKDYVYIQKLQKRIIISLTKDLNKFHNKENTREYWELILTPWLNCLTSSIYDKWENISNFEKKYQKYSTTTINALPKEYYPDSLEDFLSICLDDYWNLFIYGEILRQKKKVRLIEIKKKIKIKNKKKIKNYNIKYNFLLLIRFLLNLFNYFSKRDRVIFFKTGDEVKEFFFYIYYKTLPKYYYFSNVNTKTKSIDNTFLFSFKPKNKFENFLKKIIIDFIPKNYLTNYSNILSKLDKLNLPIKPKYIFTSIAIYNNDIFRIWVAEKKKIYSSRLIINQHGGMFGIVKFSQVQDYLLKVCYKYLSFGWTINKYKKKIIPFYNIFLRTVIQSNKLKKKNLIMIMASDPKYTHALSAKPMTGQIIDDLYFKIKLIKNLNPYIFKELTIRLYPEDFGWDLRNIIKKNIRDINFCNNNISLNNYYKNSKLIIHTYNSTTLLEAMNSNIPSIVILNKDFWELSNQAQKIFGILRLSNIFFDNSIDAAMHINKIWYNVDNWWFSSKTQKAKNLFVKNFVSNKIFLKKKKIYQIFR
jgi:putative transferase (TIGR04331 family)